MRYSNALIHLFSIIIVSIFFSIVGVAAEKILPMPEKNEEGVYTQPWFFESFLDLREDILESKSKSSFPLTTGELCG